MRTSLLYCGMRNRGGPGRIGELVRALCLDLGWEFSWLHSSAHAPPEYATDADLDVEECLGRTFHVILHNQWRVPAVFHEFQGRAAQALLTMYEEIPPYWPEFSGERNAILAPCAAVRGVLGRDVHVIPFAVPPQTAPRPPRAPGAPRFFYPARDGGANNRKGVLEFAQALKRTTAAFTVTFALTKNAHARYLNTVPELFTDSRVSVVPVLTSRDYWMHLCQADVLLCPSRTSGIELALLDALAAGTDVMVTDTAPMNEYFHDGEAWLVPATPDDSPTIGTEASTVLAVPRFRACATGLAHALEHYRPGVLRHDGPRSAGQRWGNFKIEFSRFLESLRMRSGQAPTP